MSGYPYGNPGGGYPPYGGGYDAYQSPPPPVPQYGDNQSCASLYGTPAPYDQYGGSQMPPNSNYPPPPQPAQYNSYGGSQMPPNPSYGFGAGNNYPPQPPPQQQQQSQYGGYGNQPYQAPYSSQGPPPPGPGCMYPNMSGGPPQPSYQNQQQQQQSGYYPEQQQSVLLASLEQYQGTIFPSQNFNPETDCRSLGQAMKGAGTNEQALIDIIANRSNVQRQQIKLNYKTMYGVDLVKQVAGETSGRFKEVLTALFDAPANFEAWSLHNGLNSGREGTLREILLTRTNAEIRAIAFAYREMFKKDLEHDISHRVGGTDFKRMLVSAVQANREELTPQQIQQARQMGLESVIDRNRARQDADDLYKAGEGKWGTDEKTFNAIFARRSYYQLRATFEEYQRKYRKDIAQVIRSEFSGDAKDGYLTLITCIRDRPTYFAERLHKAISGIGTRDSTLIRVLVSRSEIDLVQIKQRYQQMYNRSLARDVAGDTSGDYERILLAIVK